MSFLPMESLPTLSIFGYLGGGRVSLLSIKYLARERIKVGCALEPEAGEGGADENRLRVNPIEKG